MRIFDGLGFLLVFGILHFTIADITVSINRQPKHLRLFGFVNTTFEDIEEFDKELCKEHGGAEAHDNFKKSQKQFQRCHISLNSELLETNVKQPASYGAMYCSKLPRMENCLKNYTDSMKTCLDTNESADIIYNTFDSVMQFLCKDNGTRMAQLMQNNLSTCIYLKLLGLQNCANQTVFKYIQKTISDGASIGGLGSLHLLVPDLEKCTVLNNLKLCVIEELKTCEKSTYADLAISIFNLVAKEMTCDHLLKSQASPAGFVNIVLTTAVIVISMSFSSVVV